MKKIVSCVALMGALTLFCGCAGKCCKAPEKTASCEMKCCADAKATCATCPTCSAKK